MFSPVPAAGAPARETLLYALLLGVAGDALLRTGPGAAFPLWIALLALGALSLVWHAGRRLPTETGSWLAVAVIFAAGLAWRDSDLLDFADLLATGGALAMAAVSLRAPADGLFAPRLRDTLRAGLSVAGSVAAGFLPLALKELFGPRRRESGGARALPALRAAIFAAVLLVVFGALLRGADPIFASLLALPDVDLGEVVSHVFLIGFFAWIVAGWTRAALFDRRASRREWQALPFGLGLLDVTAALGALNLLFALFVVTQLGWFFGGEAFLHARTGLTAAQYARQGFFQMVWVVVLVVPLLVATRAALLPGSAVARRHTMLSLPLIGLLGAIILSALARMRLYVHYYGLTTERFYPLVLMAWLAFVLVWLALTVLRDRGRPFVGGAVISGLATLALLNVLAPDAMVARFNVARASEADGDRTTLDFVHLASLSGDAVPVAVAAVLHPPTAAADSATRTLVEEGRCRAAGTLLRRWGDSSARAARTRRDGAWRNWNAGDRRAVAIVRERTAELRPIGRGCVPVRPVPAPR